MIRMNLDLMDSAFNNLNLVDSAFQKYKTHMDIEISEAREKLKELQRLGSRVNDIDKLGKAIAKLKFQIPLATKKDDHHDGALSPTSKMIHSDLNLLDTAFAEAEESAHHIKGNINQAHEKFKELQTLPSSERHSYKLQKSDLDKKELQKTIAKLKVQIRSHNKIRSADSKPHHKNWDNINEDEDGMTHFFHKEPEVAHTGDFDGLLKDFHDLPEPLRRCLSCFFKFPPMATIKRTSMIYLWIGQGYISDYLHSGGCVWDDDVEVLAGKIFDDLIAKGFIEPIYQNCSLVPDECKMSLSVRSSLYEEAKDRGFISNGTSLDLDHESGVQIRQTSCLINVGEAIVNFQPEILENMKHIQSLYLGRWQSSATHHIELADAKIPHGMNKLNSLTFLSLRGISMIMELPTFISELNNLMILDLRACHNLEVIPTDIGSLKSLTHLDMSECYFLEQMPKSLAQLSNLQVLKGFLIGDFDSKQSCTLRDLSGLPKLRKLNIYISVKDFVKLQDLTYLERFESLKKLTISWGGCSLQAREEDIAKAFGVATLPPRLQKLDLQCFPMTSLTNWLMPGKLKELKKLYIRGGQLRDLGEIQKHQAERLTVEILQLKYLSKLELYWKELRTLFPKLIYLHQVECPNLFNFHCDERGMWVDHKAIDTHVQLQKYLRTCGAISSSSMVGSGSTSTQDNCNICPVDENQL
ncbi:disease resistance RPP13-like protein 4 isoform X3 [Rhododendron vialii]|nr:disease resistance RPP13-like protein 4 isoform X3 [Rhododendron vialii]